MKAKCLFFIIGITILCHSGPFEAEMPSSTFCCNGRICSSSKSKVDPDHICYTIGPIPDNIIWPAYARIFDPTRYSVFDPDRLYNGFKSLEDLIKFGKDSNSILEVLFENNLDLYIFFYQYGFFVRIKDLYG